MVTGSVIGGRFGTFARKIGAGVAFVFAMLASWMWSGSAAHAQFSSSSFPSFSPSAFCGHISSNLCIDKFDVNATNNATNSAFASHIYDASHDWVRGIIAQRRLRIDPRTGRPIAAFAAEAEPYDPIEALGITKCLDWIIG